MYNHPDPYLGYSSSMAWDATRHGSGRRPLLPGTRPSSRYSDLSLEEKLSPTTPQPRPLVKRNPPLRPVAPLLVRVAIRFADPNLVSSSYGREYRSSATFDPTDRITQGLVRRIQHSTEELITRNDSTALDAIHGPNQQPRVPRYEVTFYVVRHGATWAEQAFKSYQKQPLTTSAARDVILSSHRIVGLFLKRHDSGFRWAGSPFPEEDQHQPEMSKPGVGEPLSLACVPHSRFLEASQTFESTPGYAVEFTFTSRSRQRKQYEWRRTLKLKSTQNTPLTLALGEELLWTASKAVNDGLDARRKEFFEEHRECEWLDGVVSCQHFDDDALDVQLRVTNHLGPDHSHLHRTIRTKLGLFRHPEGLDCQSFVRDVQARLVEARDGADRQIAGLADLDFRILRLQGKHWKVDNPARFRLGPSTSYSRRTIEAILARLRTGIADVLRGNDAAIHFSAYKRGHLVLDKAIIAHATAAKDGDGHETPEEEQASFVSRLKARIQEDLDRITKDTCSLEGLPEGPTPLQEDNNTPSQQLFANISGSPATRSPSPEPRIFALVPQKYSPRVSRRISDIHEALASATNGEFDVKEPASPAFASIADLSRPSTPALSADADTSMESSLLITPATQRAETGTLEAFTPASAYLDEVGDDGAVSPDDTKVDDGEPPVLSDDLGDGDSIADDIMSPATVSISELERVLDVPDDETPKDGSEVPTGRDALGTATTERESGDEIEPAVVLEPADVTITTDSAEDISQVSRDDTATAVMSDKPSCEAELPLAQQPVYDVAPDEEVATNAQSSEESTATALAADESGGETEHAVVAEQAVPTSATDGEPVDTRQIFEEDFSRTKPEVEIEDIIELGADGSESEAASDVEETDSEGFDAGSSSAPPEEGSHSESADEIPEDEDVGATIPHPEDASEGEDEDAVPTAAESELEAQGLSPPSSPVEGPLDDVPRSEDITADFFEPLDADPAPTQPSSRSVSGSTLVSTASAHDDTGPPDLPDRPFQPSQVLKLAGWPGFADVTAKRTSLLASTHLLLSRSRPDADAPAPSNDSVETLAGSADDEEDAPPPPDPDARPRSVATAAHLGLHDYALDSWAGFLNGAARGDGAPGHNRHRRAQSAVPASLGFLADDGPGASKQRGSAAAAGKRWSVLPEPRGLGGRTVKDGVMPRVVMMVARSRIGRREGDGEAPGDALGGGFF